MGAIDSGSMDGGVSLAEKAAKPTRRYLPYWSVSDIALPRIGVVEVAETVDGGPAVRLLTGLGRVDPAQFAAGVDAAPIISGRSYGLGAFGVSDRSAVRGQVEAADRLAARLHLPALPGVDVVEVRDPVDHVDPDPLLMAAGLRHVDAAHISLTVHAAPVVRRRPYGLRGERRPVGLAAGARNVDTTLVIPRVRRPASRRAE